MTHDEILEEIMERQAEIERLDMEIANLVGANSLDVAAPIRDNLVNNASDQILGVASFSFGLIDYAATVGRSDLVNNFRQALEDLL